MSNIHFFFSFFKGNRNRTHQRQGVNWDERTKGIYTGITGRKGEKKKISRMILLLKNQILTMVCGE